MVASGTLRNLSLLRKIWVAEGWCGHVISAGEYGKKVCGGVLMIVPWVLDLIYVTLNSKGGD